MSKTVSKEMDMDILFQSLNQLLQHSPNLTQIGLTRAQYQLIELLYAQQSAKALRVDLSKKDDGYRYRGVRLYCVH